MTGISAAARFGALCALVLGLGSVGCATENKVMRGPNYSLTHPDFWKVKQVSSKDGQPSIVSIGQYSSTVVSEGVGADDSSQYESSQAEVEVRIYTWKLPDKVENPTKAVSNKLAEADPELQLTQHGLIPEQPPECGKEFKRKYTVLKQEQPALDLLKRPGFRAILVGAQHDDILLGVVSRVPYEQDGGLYCHNLSNMRTQLQTLLDNLAVAPGGGSAPPAAPGTAPTEAPAGPATSQAPAPASQ